MTPRMVHEIATVIQNFVGKYKEGKIPSEVAFKGIHEQVETLLRLTHTRTHGQQNVERMRDEFVQLVGCYNAIGLYTQARDAQRMAILLHKFVERHSLAALAWPPGVRENEHGTFLIGSNDMDITPEDL